MAQTQGEGGLKMDTAGGTSSYFHATGTAERWPAAELDESEQPFTRADFEQALKKVSRPVRSKRSRGKASS